MQNYNRDETEALPPLPFRAFKCDFVIGLMSQQSDRGHSDTTKAVNFHLTLAMRHSERESERERERLSSQQMSVTVEKMSCLYLFPSVRLLCLQFLFVAHLFILYLCTRCSHRSGVKDRTTFTQHDMKMT